jgi:epoxyqueuosine reductase
LDARRCISYLTIESNQPIPRELRAPIGDRIFGCDICQEVCPFNASPKPRPGDPSLAPFPHLQAPELATLLNLRSGEYRRFVKGTALRRASRAQLGRNAALALGNSPDPQAVPILVEALHHNTSPLVRGHVAWALGQHGGEMAREALTLRLETEEDDFVQSELRAALDVLSD